MNVVLRTEEMFGDGGVFYVPARTAEAQLRIPTWFIGGGKFPEREISAVSFPVACVYAGYRVFGLFHGAPG